MSEMTYDVPKKLTRPFRKGDLVEVCDLSLKTISVRKVVRAGKKVVVTECRRRWRASDGWWIGNNGVWPFPSIRLAKKVRAESKRT